MDNINKGATTNVYIKYCKIYKDRRYPAPNGPIGQSVNIQNKIIPMRKYIDCLLLIDGLIKRK